MLFAALRVSASVGLVGALFGEMLSSKEGLGNLLTRSVASVDTAETFALIVVVTLLSVAMIAALDLVERAVLPALATGLRRARAYSFAFL